jgi:hypothetical protein
MPPCTAFGRCVDKTWGLSEQGDSGVDESEPNLVEIALAILRLRRGDPSLSTLDLSFCGYRQIESLLQGEDSDSDDSGGADGAEKLPRRNVGRMRALAQAISASKNLTELRMVNCQMGPRACAALSPGIGQSAALRTLNLSYNRLGAEGAGCLALALAESRSLEAVILKACSIGPTECAALSEGICKSAILVELDLSYNRIEEAGALRLGQAVRNGPKRRVPLELAGVELACVAERLGLGKHSDRWTTAAILAALNDSCCSAGVEVCRDTTAD